MWTFVISEEMRQRGLAGNDLLVYAVINGYSQGEKGCYYGSRENLCEITGAAPRTIADALKRLLDRELIRKFRVDVDGHSTLAYSVIEKMQNLHTENAESARKKMQNLHTDNKEYNKYISEREKNARARENIPFSAPTVAEVGEYCKAKNYPIDPEEFIAHYESNGWMIGKVPMKSWKAALTTWAKRRANEPHQTSRPAPRRESAFERALRTGDKMFGTNWHEQMYGPNNPYDNPPSRIQQTPDEQ
jgi:hypothetical protein